MKKIVEIKKIPSRHIEVTKFICDHEGCNFETANERNADIHYGKKHIHPKRKSFRDDEFYYFNSEKDAKLWLLGKYEYGFQRNVDFEKPGWYQFERETRPCPRGCCTDDCVNLSYLSLDDFEYRLSSLREEAEDLETLIESLK